MVRHRLASERPPPRGRSLAILTQGHCAASPQATVAAQEAACGSSTCCQQRSPRGARLSALRARRRRRWRLAPLRRASPQPAGNRVGTGCGACARRAGSLFVLGCGARGCGAGSPVVNPATRLGGRRGLAGSKRPSLLRSPCSGGRAGSGPLAAVGAPGNGSGVGQAFEAVEDTPRRGGETIKHRLALPLQLLLPLPHAGPERLLGRGFQTPQFLVAQRTQEAQQT